jgi:dipicolinate synthase subunit A
MGEFTGIRVLVLRSEGRDQRVAEEIRRRGGQVSLLDPRTEPVAAGLARLDHETWLVGPVGGIGPNGIVPTDAGTVVVPPDLAARAIGVAAGSIDPTWARAAGTRTVPYREHPVFAWANAVPTAEGALHWALTASPAVLLGMAVAVAGYGRVGQVLADRLRAVGARVVVLSADPVERARARAFGFEARPLATGGSPVTLLFNTVPVPVLEAETVAGLAPKAVLDLASYPGGFTADAQAFLGTRLERRPGLPADIAPDTAASVVVDTLSILLRSDGDRDDRAHRARSTSGGGE